MGDASALPEELLGAAPAPHVVPRASRTQSCLLAVLLVASSVAEGSPQIIFGWPRRPAVRKRHSRVKYYTHQDRPQTRTRGQDTPREAASEPQVPSPAAEPSDVPQTRGRTPTISTVRGQEDAVPGWNDNSANPGATLASLGVDANHSAAPYGQASQSNVLPGVAAAAAAAAALATGGSAPSDPVGFQYSHPRRGHSTSDVASEDPEDDAGYSSSSLSDSDTSSQTQSTDSDVPMDAAMPMDRRGSDQSGLGHWAAGQGLSGSWTNLLGNLPDGPRYNQAGGTTQHASQTKAYERYLGFDTGFLASMLSPGDLCDRKFELIVDDLAFVGHPVSLPIPTASPATGPRKDRSTSSEFLAEEATGSLAFDPSSDANDGSARSLSPLRSTSRSTYSSRSHSRSTRDPSRSQSPGRGRAESAGNALKFFHFVLVLDRPDPSWNMPFLDANLVMQLFYSNVVFKMTAALLAEQERVDFVASEAHRLVSLKENCIRMGRPIKQYHTQALSTSPLARCLRSLFAQISQGQDALVVINDRVEAHLQLPPILRLGPVLHKVQDTVTDLDPNDPEWLKGAGFAGLGDGRDTFEAMMQLRPEELMYEEWTRTIGPYFLPWKTLLMMDDSAFNLPGTALGSDWPDDQPQRSDAWSKGLASTSLSMARDRTGSPEAVGMEPWAEQFIRLLRPTPEGIPTFAELQDLLGWNQCEDIYPLVRHLIYYREAKVVDVPRIKNIYMVSPLLDPVE